MSDSASERTPLSRREFLKFAAGVALATACGIPRGRSAEEVENLKSPEGGYVELGNGKSIHLTGPEGTGVYTVSYGGDIVPIQMRGDSYKEDDETNAYVYTPKEFSPGETVRRYTGEILETKIYKLSTNPELPEGKVIEVRHAPYRALRIDEINKGDTVMGIPVLTGFEAGDWNNPNPQREINPTKSRDMPGYDYWAKGWLVGEINPSQNESGEGIFLFRARGYVHRNEPLVPVGNS